MKSFLSIDGIVVGAYFLFMLAIGFYFRRVNKRAHDYFAGGNMIPWWVSGMTMYMANFSAWTFTGAAGFAYSTGWFAIIYFGLWPIAYFVGSSLTAARWRRTRSISPVEYTHTRFNVMTRQIFSWVLASNLILTAGVQLASTCKLLAPVMGLDITSVTIITGVVILLYTFAGGIWAVSITDVVQGVILLTITFIVMPLSIGLIGGFDKLFAALPALSLDHTYNNFHYTEHWLVSIIIIMSIGIAAGQAQRFYSVKDEKSAKRVGRFASLLFLTVPFVFGIPPLVAKVIWPDLSQVEFFKPYIGKNPQDLVFIAMCLKLLPNGLIGVFIAAMLAATMSTLSAVYNLVSSIIARDIYQGIIRPKTPDEALLKIGRRASIILGLIVTILAVIFINSQLGIFNTMQVFYTLLNIPIVVPIAFGLLFRSASRWSAVAGISWGLTIGVITRYLLGWDIGPQVYAQFTATSIIFLSSHWLAGMYRWHRKILYGFGAVFTLYLISFFVLTSVETLSSVSMSIIIVSACALGASLVFFSKLFATETVEQQKIVQDFFTKLDTPVDVEKEVFAAGKKQISTFPLVGATTVVMGLLMSFIFLSDVPEGEKGILAVLIGIMIVFGIMMWYFGKRSDDSVTNRRTAE